MPQWQQIQRSQAQPQIQRQDQSPQWMQEKIPRKKTEEHSPSCNRFLIRGARDYDTPERIYAILDEAEITEEGVHQFMFGGFDAAAFDARRAEIADQAAANDFAAIFDEMPIFLLEVVLSSHSFLRVHGSASTLLTGGDQEASGPTVLTEVISAAEELEGRWVELSLVDLGGSARGQLYRNLFGEPQPTAVSSISPPGAEAMLALSQVDPLAAEADAAQVDIESVLRPALAAIDEVAVYDVGQGNANGLLSSGRVMAYFDFGGGAAGNTKTFPSALSAFCFCQSDPPIILSHWDHDHWSSEGRDTRAHSKTWIAPRQPVSGGARAPHHSALVASIKTNGTLLIWPGTLPSLTVGRVTVHKCTGTSKNASGLAVEIAAPVGGVNDPVLLPADAGYDDITGAASRNFEAIACPHHGGRSNSPLIPGKPVPSYARLAYSYGPSNTYKHPLAATVTAHDAVGWTDLRLMGKPPPEYVRNTEKRSASNLGHIGFNWGARATPAPAPCSGSCNLDIQQY